MARSRFLPDSFTLLLLAVVSVATVLPCRGTWAAAFGVLTQLAIALLFFMHGVRLSRQAVVAALLHWRLHLVVLGFTFAAFPLLGLALRPLLEPLVTPELYVGLLFLCTLPSTVQSSIAFTAVARGNVPAAVCSASASTLLGIVLTPVLAGLLLSQHGASVSLDGLRAIAVQLLLPFVAGQVLRDRLGGWVGRHAKVLAPIDRSSILLVVYTTFSEAVIEGLWRHTPPRALAGLVLACAVLLALALAATTLAARRLRFPTADEIAIVFCGSKKSLASGISVARVMFSSHAVGAVLLPAMVFHQMQLMVCAMLAQHYAARVAERPA
jgi:sodium/bile acid cotransporter 7